MLQNFPGFIVIVDLHWTDRFYAQTFKIFVACFINMVGEKNLSRN